MNILTVSNLNAQKYQINKCNKNISFGCKNRLYTLEEVIDASVVSKQDVAEGLQKLVNKIKFLNKIVGPNSKTAKPITSKIGDASVYIDMDKTVKGKTKISLFADTKSIEFEYSGFGHKYKKADNSELIRQSLDIIISDKDGRMSQGALSLVDGNCTNFERDLKTGKRYARGKYFLLEPGVNECIDQGFEMEDFAHNKTCLIIRNIFSKLFSNLSLVKPDINLLK